jgi:hypothetical protein
MTAAGASQSICLIRMALAQWVIHLFWSEKTCDPGGLGRNEDQGFSVNSRLTVAPPSISSPRNPEPDPPGGEKSAKRVKSKKYKMWYINQERNERRSLRRALSPTRSRKHVSETSWGITSYSLDLTCLDIEHKTNSHVR